MASAVIYPPIVSSSVPAVVGSEQVSSGIKIPIDYSILTSATPANAHISICDKETGENKATTSCGIIFNKPILTDSDTGQYYILLQWQDFYSGLTPTGSDYTEDRPWGWEEGNSYKIQVRFSSVEYDTTFQTLLLQNPRATSSDMATLGITTTPYAWMNTYADSFSEWSTICLLKVIPKPRIVITSYGDSGYDTDSDSNDEVGSITSLRVIGKYENSDDKEILSSYQILVFDSTTYSGVSDADDLTSEEALEDSGEIITTAEDRNIFRYTCKTEGEPDDIFYLRLYYTTINGYNSYLDLAVIIIANSLVDQNIFLVTADNDSTGILDDITTIREEEEEGCLGLGVYSTDSSAFSGSVCIRRSSSKDNFERWYDVAIINLTAQNLKQDPLMWYDYTIENGIWYKYGIQVIAISSLDTTTYDRSSLQIIDEPVIREFDYCFLLGADNQQLKLPFNTSLTNFSHNHTDSKITTIGSRFPFITRTTNNDYRSFQLSSLITRWTDTRDHFLTDEEVYEDNSGTSTIVGLYDVYNSTNDIEQYDYTYERFFREKVSSFLRKNDIKLFKSPTEGNILVRITDVSFSPNEILSRMLYTFSATLNEMMENTIENLLSCGLLTVDTPTSSGNITKIKLGQITGEISLTDNLFDLILEKYNEENVFGYDLTVTEVLGLEIFIEDEKWLISYNDNDFMGHQFIYNDGSASQVFNIYNSYYNCGEEKTFDPNSDSIIFSNDKNGDKTSINIIANFVYCQEVSATSSSSYIITSSNSKTVVSQVHEVISPGTDIYSIIQNKYKIDWSSYYRQITNVLGVKIEAPVRSVFYIMDGSESSSEYHDVGMTGILDLSVVTGVQKMFYVGIRQDDGTIDTSESNFILVDFIVTYQYGSRTPSN